MPKKVKLNAPVSTLAGAVNVLEAGADEIYCGVKIRGMKYVTFNGRPAYCSLDNFQQLKTVTEMAHKHNAEVNFVLNLPFITDILDVLAKPYIKKAVNAGIDNIIAADTGYLLLLEKLKIKTPLHIGSFAAVRNNEALEFYTQFNVRRIIAPPDTTVTELKSLAENKHHIEIEAFIHGQGCSNVNGNCYLFHSYRPQSEEFPADPLWAEQKDRSLVAIGIRNPCMFNYTVTDLVSGEAQESRILDAYPFCSFCRLDQVLATGAAALKIEGRCQPVEFQARTTHEYRRLIDRLENNDSNGYREEVEKLKQNSPELRNLCRLNRCYYKGDYKGES
ncbi:MAG TPA: peptidase U32 family protein [Candidatus Deferrimicrobium sp.]|nr:peptidase U32 family protein [Candidatus Deferrimicrobium sp.]